jgi:hypothetical protein
MHPSDEAMEARNAYTDWLLRQRDERERVDEMRAEGRREEMRSTPHKPRIGLAGPNFCEACGANVAVHEHIPYGRKNQ